MANRYWVQGTGSWSDDDNHWATSSGGSPGDGNLPTSSDNVYFDSNSGFGSGGTLTIDVSNGAICNFFEISSGTFTISGNLVTDSYFDLDGGTVIFNGNLTAGDNIEIYAGNASI